MKMQAGVWGRWAEWAGSRENPGPRSLCFLNRDVELWASPMVQWVKNPPAVKETWVWFLDWEDPWKSTWQLTPEFLPGKPCGQRSLSSYCPWGPKESGMTAVTEHKPNCGLFALVVIYDLHDVRSGGSHHHNHSCCGATWAISRNKLDPDFNGAWEGLLKCFLLDSLSAGDGNLLVVFFFSGPSLGINRIQISVEPERVYWNEGLSAGLSLSWGWKLAGCFSPFFQELHVVLHVALLLHVAFQ